MRKPPKTPSLPSLKKVATLAPKPAENETEPYQHRLPPAPQVAAVYTRIALAKRPASSQRMGSSPGPLLLGTRQLVRHDDPRRLPARQHRPLCRHNPLQPLVLRPSRPAGSLRPSLPPGRVSSTCSPCRSRRHLASLAGVNQPPAAVGRVLTEAIRTTRPAPTQ